MAARFPKDEQGFEMRLSLEDHVRSAISELEHEVHSGDAGPAQAQALEKLKSVLVLLRADKV